MRPPQMAKAPSRKPTRSRRARALRSLVVAALTFGMLEGTLLASGSLPDGSDPELRIGAVRLGDQGSYVAMAGPLEGTRLDFHWAEAGPRIRADGRAVATDRLDLATHGAQGVAQATHYVAAGTALPVSRTTVGHGVEVWHGLPGGIPVPMLRSESSLEARTELFGAPSAPPCFLANAHQGTTVPAGTPLAFPAGCFGSDTGQPVVLRPSGVERVHGHAAVRFDGQEAALWYAQGLPYPLQVQLALPDGAVRLRLASFQAGTDRSHAFPAAEASASAHPVGNAAAPAMPAQGPAVAGAPIDQRPWRPWGLDDAGAAVPFPLSSAYAAALADPASGLASYLADHPEAYAAAAIPVQAHHGSDTAHRWFLLLTDGRMPFCLNVERVDWLGLGWGPVQSWGQEGACMDVIVADDRGLRGGSPFMPDVPFGHPPPSRRPSAAPAASALMARWQDHARAEGTTDAPDAYGHVLLCVDPACEEVALRALAGRLEASSGLRISVLDGTRRVASSAQDVLWTDGQGMALELVRMVEAHRSGLQGVAEPAPGPRPQPETLPTATGFSWPTPTWQQAVGMGLLAALAGLAHYAWSSALRGAGLALLFSRVHGPAAARHPRRALLLQCIAAAPGIHFEELRRRTGFSNGALTHHLRTLQRTGHVTAVRLPGHTCYFAGRPDPAVASQAVRLRSGTARRIHDALSLEPGLSAAALARRTGLPESTVRYHLRRMAEAPGGRPGLSPGNRLGSAPEPDGLPSPS